MYRHYSKDQNAETHERMKAANRDCNKIIAQAKKDHWIAFADSISAGKADLGSVWKKIRRMKQQCVVPDSDLQHGSTKYTTAQSKADALAKAFAEASDTDSLPADRQQFRREMEVTFTHPVPDDSLAVNTPLTCTELRRALASIKKVKVSTGVDTVSYRMLKEAPESFLKILLDFFQRCWDGGTIPAGWKHAIVVPIHKHGKPRKELGSYRPISLTSHLGEVYERVIKNRLEYHCESKKVFPVCQAGFRRERGVTDHLVKLGEQVGRAIGRRKVLLTCFFDISRAYDQVWHATLLQKLDKIGISGNMYRQLHQILPERQIDAGQVEGSHVDHQRSKYGRSSGICDRPPVVQHHGPRRGHGSEGKGSADHVRRRPGDMDRHPHQTSPHKQLVGETKHETVPGSCGRGGPLYASKWIRSLFPENGVRPIPHQHLSGRTRRCTSGWTGRASLHRKKSSTWVYTSLAGGVRTSRSRTTRGTPPAEPSTWSRCYLLSPGRTPPRSLWTWCGPWCAHACRTDCAVCDWPSGCRSPCRSAWCNDREAGLLPFRRHIQLEMPDCRQLHRRRECYLP